MDLIINLDIPHIGEQIFENIDTDTLVGCLTVSKTWKVLAENVLFKRFKNELVRACRFESAKIVKILIERSDSEVLNSRQKVLVTREDQTPFEADRTPFQVACEFGHTGIVKLLLSHAESKDIDLNAKSEFGYTGLMFACWDGHERTVKAILDYEGGQPIDMNAKDTQYGSTAFSLACNRDEIDVVKLLMDYSKSKNIDLNAIDDGRYGNGTTAFMSACTGHGADVVRVHLENWNDQMNIDFNAIHNGRTAFMIACCRSPYNTLLEENLDTVKLFLEHAESRGINLNATFTHYGVEWNAFMLSCLHGTAEVVQLLLDHSNIIHIDINAALQIPQIYEKIEIRSLLEKYSENPKKKLKTCNIF